MADKMTRLTCAFCFLAGCLAIAGTVDTAAVTIDTRLVQIEERVSRTETYTAAVTQLARAVPLSQLQPAPARHTESARHVASR